MIRILIKNRLRSFLGTVVGRTKSGKVEKASRGKLIGLALLYAFVVGMFAFISLSASMAMGLVLIPIGAGWLYFSIFILASLSIIFIFSIFETKSELFECKDNDLLLSMPIKPRDIVAARVSVVVIYNYLEELVIMTPCIIVYAVMSGDILGVIGAVIVSLFLPLIATSLASAVGYLVALISRRMKRKNFVTVALSLLFLVAYFLGYNTLVEGMETFLGSVEEAGGVAPSDMRVLYYIGSAVFFHHVSLPVLIGAAILISAVTYYIISKSYIKIVSERTASAHTVTKASGFKSRTPFFSLVRKELGLFFSSATYMLNSGLGLVFEIIIGIVAIVEHSELRAVATELLEEGFAVAYIAVIPIAICVQILLSSFNTMSSCALSLEGKQLWNIKTMPIDDKTVLLTKAMPQVIITALPSFITSVCFMIALGVPAEYWLFFVIIPIMSNTFSALFGGVMNALFPKLQFENEAQPIKQSLSTFLTMTAQMFMGIIAVIGTFILSLILHPLIVCTILLLVFSALSVGFYFILTGPCARKYAEIDC